MGRERVWQEGVAGGQVCEARAAGGGAGRQVQACVGGWWWAGGRRGTSGQVGGQAARQAWWGRKWAVYCGRLAAGRAACQRDSGGRRVLGRQRWGGGQVVAVAGRGGLPASRL